MPPAVPALRDVERVVAADVNALDTLDPGNDRREVLDHPCRGVLAEHATQVAPVPNQRLVRFRPLRLPHGHRIERVDDHVLEQVEHLRKPVGAGQKQVVGGRRLVSGLKVMSPDPYVITDAFERARAPCEEVLAHLPLHDTSTPRRGSDLEGVGSRREIPLAPVTNGEIDAHQEAVRRLGRLPAYLGEATPTSQSLVEVGVQSIPGELQGVEEIALSACVGADQNGQVPQLHVTTPDAAEVAQPDPLDRRG